jgi:hypothetical protein
LGERNEREPVPIPLDKAQEFQVELDRFLPQIRAAAASGFPVPAAIPN